MSRRYPLQPLIDAIGIDGPILRREGTSLSVDQQAAYAIGVDQSAVRRARRLGLSEALADRWAIRAGLHPDLVWDGFMSREVSR